MLHDTHNKEVIVKEQTPSEVCTAFAKTLGLPDPENAPVFLVVLGMKQTIAMLEKHFGMDPTKTDVGGDQ